MQDFKKSRYNKLGEKVVASLNKRHFDAYYFSSKEEAIEKILNLIPKENIVSWGGSMTAQELNIYNVLKENNYKLIDRDTAKSPDERSDLMHQSLLCDSYIMSANAITEEGELFNIDKVGNRVAALSYGPKNVIVIAGMNKIVKNIDEAYSHVRNTVAPENVQRLGLNTPCFITGQCSDCVSSDCCCAQMVTTRLSVPAGRIKVILIGEVLGI